MHEMVEIFKALANRNRMRIYRVIRVKTIEFKDSTEECCVGDICREFQITPSTVSHHLKELRRAGLITMEKEGQFSHVFVNEEIFDEIRKFFSDEEEW